MQTDVIPYSHFYQGETVSLDSFNRLCTENKEEGYRITKSYESVCKMFTPNTNATTNGTMPWHWDSDTPKKFIDAGYLVTHPPSFEDNPIKACHYGFLFNVYVLLQLFNLVNARKLMAHEWNPFANFFNNKYFLFILVIAIIVQVGLVCLDFLGSVLKIKRPSMALLGISLALGSTSILWGKYNRSSSPFRLCPPPRTAVSLRKDPAGRDSDDR